MSLLTPLFLAGLGMIALPVWLHLLQTQNPEREPFSSAMLLEPSKQNIYTQRKLRYLLLLALRILFLTILVLAFAKPVLESTTEVFLADDASLHLIVIDTSFSMGFNDRINLAITVSERLIDELEPGHPAQIITAGDQIRLLSGITNDKSELISALAAVQPGQSRLDYGVLMNGINDVLDDYNQNTVIHLLTDFQATALPPRFADLIPKTHKQGSIELDFHDLGDDGSPNWSVEFIRRWNDGIQVGIRAAKTESAQRTLTLYINGDESASKTVQVPADGQAVFEFSNLELAEGDNRVEVLMLPADELPGDDRFYAVIENTPPTPVLLLTPDIKSLAVTYLKTALETGNYNVETVAFPELDPRILQRYPWIIINDIGAMTAATAEAMTDYLNAGGAVFCTMSEKTSGLDVLPVSHHALKGSRLSGQAQFKSISKIDTSHPILANSPGWRNVNISRVIALETRPEDRIMISLEQDEPLLLEQNIGAGKLLLLTTNLDNTWTDLPIHTVFVSFMSETARYLSGEDQLERQHHAGDSILLKQVGGASGQILDPEGKTILDLADTHSSQNVKLKQPGFYEVYTTGRQMLIAVNPDPRESNLEQIRPEMKVRWSQSGITEPVPGQDGKLNVEPVRLELWHALLFLLVLIVLAESILGNRYLDYKTGQY